MFRTVGCIHLRGQSEIRRVSIQAGYFHVVWFGIRSPAFGFIIPERSFTETDYHFLCQAFSLGEFD